MKNKIYFVIVMLAGALQSCSDYLDEQNPNSLSTDTYWTSLEESESNLTSVYGAMLDNWVLDIEDEFFRTDLAHPGKRTNPTGAYLPWYQQRLLADNAAVGKQWDSKYRVIWRANQVIEGLNGMSPDLKSNERWTEQMAQARFFRGLMHFYLHNIFNDGKIIIRDKIPQESTDYSKKLSTSEEVINFFREDLEYAYQNLPAQFDQKTRVDAGAVATILGTSYLYEGNYEKAMIYFKDVINNGAYGYSLETDVSILFTNTGDFNSESIFEINYSIDHQLEDGNFDEQSFFHRLSRYSAPSGRNVAAGRTIGGQGILLPSAWLTYEYSNEPMDTQDSRNYINDDVTGQLRTIPLRGSQSIAVVNDTLSPYYLFNAPQVTAFDKTSFSYYKKYTNHDIVSAEFDTGTSPWKSGRNIVVNRLSGVYLMYAECLTKTGDINGALSYINQIRQRWGLQLLGVSDGSPHDFDGEVYTESTLMDHLMYKEYPLELSVEGFSTRFIDLRRWGVAQERFSELSMTPFHLIDFSYTDAKGKEALRKQSLLEKGPGKKEFVEYTDAANAWASPNPAYLPIPQSEILNNQEIN